VKSLRENGLDAPLLDRAVSALLKHDETSSGKRKSTPLVEDDRDVHVQFALARVPQRPSPKPIRVDIPHPFIRVPRLEGDDLGKDDADKDNDYLEEADVCLLVSNDHTKTWVKELIERFPSHLGCIKKVMTLDSLRTKHKRFDRRRVILESYDVFLADDRILPMLGKALGKSFFKKKNLPVPIKITRKEAFPFTVQRCLRATYMYLSAGTCVTVKVGTTGMPPRHLAENVQSAVQNTVEKLPRKWANVSGIFVKTPRSVALPLYSRTPEELAEIASLAAIADDVAVDEMGTTTTIKKRKGASEGEEVAKKKKKRKKELKEKSPLLKALKKQKQTEEEGKVDSASTDEEAKDEAKTSKKKKGAAMEKKEAEVESAANVVPAKKEEGAQSTKERKKKRKVKAVESDKVKVEDAVKKEEVAQSAKEKKRKGGAKKEEDEGESEQPKNAKKKKKQKDSKKKEEDSESEKGKKENGATEDKAKGESEPPKSAKKKKKQKDSEKKEEGAQLAKKKKQKAAVEEEGAKERKQPKSGKKQKDDSDGGKDFLPSKKFRGAKKGYHFRKGKEGVGYYKDTVPVPDRAALEAMTRAYRSTPSRGGGGGGKSRRKAGGRGRRS